MKTHSDTIRINKNLHTKVSAQAPFGDHSTCLDLPYLSHPALEKKTYYLIPYEDR